MKSLEGIKIGFAICGSFCTLAKTYAVIEKLMSEGARVYPIMSEHASTIDSRFGTSEEFIKKLEEITGHKMQIKINETEKIGPNNTYDILVVAPCTGNTMAKLAYAITDTSVLMAIKATLRNQTPVVLSIATNDALGLNLKNIGQLINIKNIYFVPFGQDNYKTKNNSMVSKMDLVYDTVIEALKGKQIQPILINYEIDN